MEPMEHTGLIISTAAVTLLFCCVWAIASSGVLPLRKGMLGAGRDTNPLKKWLIAAYLSAALLFSLRFLTVDDLPEQLCWIPAVVMVSLWSVLVCYGVLSMLNPRYGHTAQVLVQLVGPACVVLLWIVAYIRYGAPDTSTFTKLAEGLKHWTVLLWGALLLYCIGQLTYYSYLFYKELSVYKESHPGLSAPINELKPMWVGRLFCLAQGIGVVGLAAVLTVGTHAGIVLQAVVLLGCLAFAVRYVRYAYGIPLLETVSLLTEQDVPHSGKLNVGRRLEQYVADSEFYTASRMTIEEVASKIGVSRTLLSNHLNREKGMTFSAWICGLRVEYAKQLMLNHGAMSVAAVAEKVGFSETTNFVRKFRQSTGYTPLKWKKLQIH